MAHVRFDDAYFAAPEEYARQLAEDGPIHRFSSPHGVSGWMITGHDLARKVFTDLAFLKTPASMSASSMPAAGRVSPRARLTRAANSWMVSHMLGTDGPEHTRLRAVVAEPFSPRAIAARRPRMIEIADELVAQMDPTQPVDLAAAYAVPLPVRNIAEMLGIPVADAGEISRASANLGDVLCSSSAELRSAALIFARLLLPALAVRRIAPREDVLSTLLAQYRDGALTLRETLSTAALLLIAGHEAVTGLILSTVMNLLRHPEQMNRVRSDPDALVPIIEETLRLDSPQPVATLRVAGETMQVGGHVIEAGEWILISLFAAGHDPHRYQCPEAFDTTRARRGGVAFGHGIHTCLGAQLARVEAHAAITRLLDRYPGIRLAGDPGTLTARRSIFFRRLENLPVILQSHTL